MAEQAIVVLGGASKTWKSFLVLDWHLCLYWGLSWRGRRVRAGSSVYFCGEGQAYAGRRVKAWLQHNAERIRSIDASKRVFEIVGEVPRLTKPEGIAELRACVRDFVRRHGPVSMVTIDTLSVGLSGDDDENSNAMMGAIVAELAKIRSEFGCTIILVHHLRKDAVDANGNISMTALRGGVALPCNTDQVFLVSVKDGEQTITLDKNKDGEDGVDVASSTFQVVTLGTDDEGFPITSGVLLPLLTDLEAAQAARLNELVEHYRRTFGDEEFTQSNAEQMKPSKWGRQEVRDMLAIARETRRIEWRLEGKTVLHRVPGGAP